MDAISTLVNLRRGVRLAFMGPKKNALNERMGDRYQTGTSARKPRPLTTKARVLYLCHATKLTTEAASTRQALMIDEESGISDFDVSRIW